MAWHRLTLDFIFAPCIQADANTSLCPPGNIILLACTDILKCSTIFASQKKQFSEAFMLTWVFAIFLFPIWRSMTDLQQFFGSEKCRLWTVLSFDALKQQGGKLLCQLSAPEDLVSSRQDPNTSRRRCGWLAFSYFLPTCEEPVWFPFFSSAFWTRVSMRQGSSACFQIEPQPQCNQD